jgi:RNA polymerase sigma-70 factor (ECF subfamily)
MESTRPAAPAAGDAADRAAIQRFRAGRDQAEVIAELYDRHAPVTFGFFARRVGDREVAAELNQDLFLAVVRGLPSFRGESSFRTWLFRLAHNELSNLRRRWRTHLDEQSPDVPEELWSSLVADGPSADPERPVLDAARDLVITRCLAALNEQERAVVRGQYYEQVTLAELTDRLSLDNPSGARALLISAQRALRKCLAAQGVDR